MKLLWPVSVLIPLVSLLLLVKLTTVEARQKLIKLHLYADDEAFYRWMKITGRNNKDKALFERELRVTVGEVNELMKSSLSLPGNMEVRIMVEKFKLLNNTEFWSDKIELDSYDKDHGYHRYMTGLRKHLVDFQNYLKPTFSKDPYDLALLLTGNNLKHPGSDRDSAYGYAFIGTVCSPSSVTILEIFATFDDVIHMAHEIGHVLGANHDGSEGCPDKWNIMYPISHHFSANKFHYSSCSASAISKQFNEPTTTCLDDGQYTEVGERYGALVGVREICKRENKHLGPAILLYDSYGDDVCLQFKCLLEYPPDGSKRYQNVATPNGVTCGREKICYHGKCIHDAKHGDPNVSDNCPWGEMSFVWRERTKVTCAQIKQLGECNKYKRACCKTC